MINIISWNVKGLRSPNKRMKILRHLKRHKVNIALLQETHLQVEDYHRMRKLWVGEVVGSPALGNKAGVMILFNKNLSYNILSVENDTHGRLVTTGVKFPTFSIQITNVYAPNSPDEKALAFITEWGLKTSLTHHVLGGDFNTVLHPNEDRDLVKHTNRKFRETHNTSTQVSPLSHVISALGMVDAWRLMHPVDREFTFFSHPHNSWARLDYLFCTPNLIPHLGHAEILDMAISDHSPITLDIGSSPSHSNTRLWRFPSYLSQNPDFQLHLQNAWSEFESYNKVEDTNPITHWEAAKAFIRGKVIAYVTAFKKSSLSKYQTASTTLRQTQQTLYGSNTPENRKAWQEAKRSFDLWADHQERIKGASFDLKLHKFGNKAGKLLARLTKGPHKQTYITTLKNDKDQLTTSPPEIAEILENFYKTLYSEDALNKDLARSFLDKLNLPQISSSALEKLNAPISEEEILHTIKTTPSNKAPGPDGYTIEFYKAIAPHIIPTLLKVYNLMWKEGSYLPTGNQAYIKLLEKKGKDPTHPGSYRPISLLNIDAKIISKIIASRLAVILPSLIHPTQAGFIKGRSATANIRKVLLALDYAKTHPNEDLAIITLDAEKAFDNVSISWLFMVLRKLGFGGHFMTFLSGMYASPTAKIITPTFTTNNFSLKKGTRQGCPLSPLLFNIALEPFSRHLLNHSDLHGIKIGSQEIRTALFADDMLLFTTELKQDLSTLKNNLELFKQCSGMRINYDKSEILPLTKATSVEFIKSSAFSLAKNHITYLGINIGKDPSSIYHLNYPELIGKITKELEAWNTLPISLFGRCHLVKMVSFARLLYPLQTIPLLLRHSDIQKINRSIASFIWNKKRSRISLKKLHLPKSEGGVGLPNIRKYNLACLLRYSLDWQSSSSIYTNLDLESEYIHPYSLSGIIHSNWKSLPPRIRYNILYRDTIISWRETRKLVKLPTGLSPHLTIQGNPMFPQGSRPGPFMLWQQRGLRKIPQLYDLSTGSSLPFETLANSFNLPKNHEFFFNQIISFVHSTCPHKNKRFVHSFTDTLIRSKSYTISDIYKRLLSETQHTAKGQNLNNWHKDIQSEDLDIKLLQGYRKVTNIMINETWREMQFKLLHRAYFPFLTSEKSNPYYRSCPHCGTHKPSLFHRLWSCPPIANFWDQVSVFMEFITKKKLHKSPLLFLFSYEDSAPQPTSAKTTSTHIHQWSHLCLLAARRVLMKTWTKPPPPSITLLKKELTELLYKEKLDAVLQNHVPTKRFFIRWRQYIEGTFSPSEISELMSSFQYSEWYLKANISNTLGTLRIQPTLTDSTSTDSSN